MPLRPRRSSNDATRHGWREAPNPADLWFHRCAWIILLLLVVGVVARLCLLRVAVLRAPARGRTALMPHTGQMK